MTEKQRYEDPESRIEISPRIIPRLAKHDKTQKLSTELWQAHFDAISEPICILDPKGNILQCNIAMQVFLDKPLDRILNQKCWELVHGTSEPIEGCPIIRLRETLHRESSVLQVDNKWIEVVAYPHLDEHENIIDIKHVMTDITERKRAEEALQLQEMQVRTILESTCDGILVVDNKGSVIKTNQRFADLWKIPSHLLEKGSDEALLTHILGQLVDPDAFLKKVHVLYASTEVDLDTVFFKDGRAMERYSCPLLYEGVIHGRVWSFRDITERKRLTQERFAMEQKLLQTQKLESLGVLAGGIAHNFNNILMAIFGNLELAMEEISPLSSARPYLENICQASQRAAELIRQMLAYSGKGRFVIEGMNLSELIQENIRIFRASIPATIDLNLQLNRDIPFIMADTGRIQQVVMNLITNGAEAIGDNAGTITLTTGIQSCDEGCLKQSRSPGKPAPGVFVYLEVADTGCGMDEETQQKIFNPFFTTKFIGRGLGMSVLQGIVMGHKGAIFLDSEVGKGTTIRVIFPVSDAVQETKTPVVQMQEVPLAADNASLPGIILIVDDEDDVRQLCRTMAHLIGYRTLTAADGEEAVEVFRDHAGEIICVILDLTMPKMDGYATFQAMKQLRPDVKVILSSGYNEQAVTQRFTGLGLAGFIQKPYRRQQLQDELKRVMKGG